MGHLASHDLTTTAQGFSLRKGWIEAEHILVQVE